MVGRVNRTAMPSDVRQPDAFIAYPTNRVVGTLVDPTHAQAAIEALLQIGFARQDIDILHGEEDLHRPDRSGAEHRFLAQFQRTLIRTLGDEHKHLQHYIEDVRAGRSVIMVLAKERDKREAAADILGAHGAESIEFYGRWSWHSLEAHAAAPLDGSLPDPAPGRTYEIHLGETTTRVRFDSPSRVTILRRSLGSPDLSRLPVTHLKPHLLMITWQEADRTTNVHVYDFESGEAHAVVSYFNRSVHRAKGTVRRAD
jgi:MoaF-like